MSVWDRILEELGEFVGDPFRGGVAQATDDRLIFVNADMFATKEEMVQFIEEQEPGYFETAADRITSHPDYIESTKNTGLFIEDLQSGGKYFQVAQDILKQEVFDLVQAGIPAAVVPGTPGVCIVNEATGPFKDIQYLMNYVAGSGQEIDIKGLDTDDLWRIAGHHEGTHCENDHYAINIQGTNQNEIEADTAALKAEISRGGEQNIQAALKLIVVRSLNSHTSIHNTAGHIDFVGMLKDVPDLDPRIVQKLLDDLNGSDVYGNDVLEGIVNKLTGFGIETNATGSQTIPITPGPEQERSLSTSPAPQ